MMTHVEALLPSLPVLLAQVFFTGLWQGAATVLVVTGMLRMFPRAGAEARYAALSVAFVLLAVLPWIHLPGSAVQGVGAGAAVRVLPVVSTVIAAVWAGLATLRAVQLLLAYRHLRAVWRRAVPLQGRQKDQLPLSPGMARVVLCTSADVDSPTVLGFRRPRLLLPEWMAPTLTEADLRHIALHECEHLRRGDDWMNLLQQIALLVLPLHPALLWLNRRLNLQRELACDAGVVARTAEPIAYASCLTRLAEQRLQHRRRLRLALAAWERRSELVRRVHVLLSDAAPWTAAQSRLAAAAMTLVFAAGALVMARAPQFVQVEDREAPGAVAASVAGSDAFRQDVVSRGASMLPAKYRVHSQMEKPGAKAGFAMAEFQEPGRRAVPERKKAAISRVRSVPRKRSATGPGSLLTISHSRTPMRAADPPMRLVNTEFTYAYAAVPFGDGWLLIQL